VAEYSIPTARFSTANGDDTVTPRRISPLELLHPNGVTKRSTIIGSNYPALLLRTGCAEDDERVDLNIVQSLALNRITVKESMSVSG
jgi:hypothetical protein